jgi:hypothetical protein
MVTTETWQSLGCIAPGGSVLSLAARADGQAWLATGSAIWMRTDQGWRPLPHQLPLQQAGFVAASTGIWWAGGLTGELVGTRNGGRSWWTPWTDGISAPVTCIAVSPRHLTDATLLAGTGGAGILRSTDAGRRWLLSNFGLQEFTILALATATDWSRREVIFAGTVDGLYRSSGGGRAWKPVALEGQVVQALATSRDFTRSGLVLAGTEGRGLFRSADGGVTWEPAGNEIGREASVNALLRVDADGAEGWVAGTDGGQLWRSTDGGSTWILASDLGTPVLALAGGQGALPIWAGTADQGVLVSADGGRSWQVDLTLCAWGFRRLIPECKAGLLALAPTGGAWRSGDGGRTWKRVAAASLHEPILAYAVAGSAALEARSDGVWRSEGGGDAELVLEVEDAPVTAVVVARGLGPAWAGTADALLWESTDAGLTWQAMVTPFAGQALAGLALSPDDGMPVVGTYAADDRSMTLWRFAAGHWERWLSRQVEWPALALVVGGASGEQTWAAVGGHVWEWKSGEWHEVEITADGALVLALAGGLEGPRYVIAGGQLLSQEGEHGWVPRPLPADAAAPVDLAVAPRAGLLCLDAAGVIWQMNE